MGIWSLIFDVFLRALSTWVISHTEVFHLLKIDKSFSPKTGREDNQRKPPPKLSWLLPVGLARNCINWGILPAYSWLQTSKAHFKKFWSQYWLFGLFFAVFSNFSTFTTLRLGKSFLSSNYDTLSCYYWFVVKFININHI